MLEALLPEQYHRRLLQVSNRLVHWFVIVTLLLGSIWFIIAGVFVWLKRKPVGRSPEVAGKAFIAMGIAMAVGLALLVFIRPPFLGLLPQALVLPGFLWAVRKPREGR